MVEHYRVERWKLGSNVEQGQEALIAKQRQIQKQDGINVPGSQILMRKFWRVAGYTPIFLFKIMLRYANK